MKKILLISGALAMIGAVPVAEAAVTTYNVVETFYEPDTQPNNTIFTGSFSYDSVSHSVSKLQGLLTESMTGDGTGNGMTELALNYQLSSVYYPTLGGLLVTTFLNNSTNTFKASSTAAYTWAPGGTKYYGPAAQGNAYAMIFVNTTDPLAPLSQAQIDKLAYADCTPDGMMGKTCMTGTTLAGYGRIGTMSGIPVSQTITAAVPEPQSYAMLIAGLGLMGLSARRRRHSA